MKYLGCYGVKATPADWCAAAEILVRPKEVRAVADHLHARARLGTSRAELIGTFLAEGHVTGRLVYAVDPPEGDIWCSPWATLLRGRGDCEDLSGVALSLALAMGVDAYIVIGRMPHGGDLVGHAWVEGHDELGLFVIEATTGTVLSSRPQSYLADFVLGPGLCLRAA